jgi:hypothetical protein
MEFNCELCKYKTNHQTNYKKHLCSKKHKNNEDEHNKKQFSCKYCGQMYHHKQSVNKHVKYSCTKNKDEDLKELVRLLNNQNKQLVIKVENQSKQIEKLMGKLEINNSFNTNIVNNIQNITLLSYKETDTSHLTDTDYITCIKTKNGCVVKMIEKVHFNPKKPENMNLFIPSMKDKYVMVYEDGNWNLIHKNDVIEKLYDEKEELISGWIQIHPHEIESKANFEKYLHIKNTDDDNKNIKSLHDQTRVLLYNNRRTKNQIES